MEGLGFIDPSLRFRSVSMGILQGLSRSPPPPTVPFSRGKFVRAVGSAEGDCRICASSGGLWARFAGGVVEGGGDLVGKTGGFSHESEHDLALMVSEFMENESSGGGGGADSRHSSDSESGFSEFGCLADRIALYKLTMDQFESDLSFAVHSILLSIAEADLMLRKCDQCSSSGCIRYLLVKHLRRSGYDAAVCTSRWELNGKFLGGDHEYIDVVLNVNGESSERLIVDIDFRSHFEIARPVKFYDAILASLPIVFVGSPTRLELFLQVMVEAAKASLKQNSMPLPPWRSLAYLQAKWHSKCERVLAPTGLYHGLAGPLLDHRQCVGHLRRLKSALQPELDTETDRLLKPTAAADERKRRTQFDWPRLSMLSS